MAFCEKCGAQLQEGAKFCMKCGTPVEENFQQPNPSEQPYQQPVQPDPQPAQPNPTYLQPRSLVMPGSMQSRESHCSWCRLRILCFPFC